MIPETRQPVFRLSRTLSVLVLLGMVLSSNAFGADKYYVYTHFISLGEVIAKPMLEVTEGETAGGTYSVVGDAQYKIVVLVRKAAENEVSISLQFSSGNVNIQPNLMVELDKEISRTYDGKILMKLLVQKVPEGLESANSKPEQG